MHLKEKKLSSLDFYWILHCFPFLYYKSSSLPSLSLNHEHTSLHLCGMMERILLISQRHTFSCVCVCVCTHSVVSDFATPQTVAHQAPLSMGILQARILKWVIISYSRRSFWPRDWTYVSCFSCIGRQILYHWAIWETAFSSTGASSTLLRGTKEVT